MTTPNRTEESRNRDSIHDLRGNINTVKVDQATTAAILAELAKDVAVIGKIVTGNGTPKEGLVVQVASLLWQQKLQTAILSALFLGAVYQVGGKIVDSIHFSSGAKAATTQVAESN